MGLFSSRPEEPDEWAGLPSEPVAPESSAATLPEPPIADPFGGIFGTEAVQSIVIPAAPSAETTAHDSAVDDIDTVPDGVERDAADPDDRPHP